MTTTASLLCLTTAAVFSIAMSTVQAQSPADQPADMSKKVQVFILLGQSNMVGLGKVKGGEIGLEHVVKEKKKYSYLLSDTGDWAERKDVRYARVMSGRGGGMQRLNNEWMTVKTCKTIGPEFGIAKKVGDAVEEPVLMLKSCIGNRSLGWDLLPPGSERYEFVLKDKTGAEKPMIYAGYKDRPDSWELDKALGLKTEPGPWVDKKTGKPIDWYAGKQWDDDTSHAKTVLAELDKHYPGAKGYEVAGFFFWQGEKDAGNPGHAARYEQNLVRFIKKLREEFNAPTAKFVLGTLGESVKGGGNGGLILDAQLAVDGTTGKYPEFKGNVATVYTHPMAQGGSGNGHYGGKAEVYMDVGEAMGTAMVTLLKGKGR
ncbi:sialate O-acetylesterase [Prosthecobacter sp.]|jgi:hypothetical protein|uniref:sialate O-acetylesterase n=1 Tax=Prosthecobacter sp. TaxID=1965333 RepID=UPI00378515B1